MSKDPPTSGPRAPEREEQGEEERAGRELVRAAAALPVLESDLGGVAEQRPERQARRAEHEEDVRDLRAGRDCSYNCWRK